MTEGYVWRPVIGLVQAQETIVLEIVPPIKAGYVPVLVSNHHGKIGIKPHTPSQVSVTNTLPIAVPFVVCVLPGKIAQAVGLPWHALATTLRAHLKTAEGRKVIVKAFIKSALQRILTP